MMNIVIAFNGVQCKCKSKNLRENVKKLLFYESFLLKVLILRIFAMVKVLMAGNMLS